MTVKELKEELEKYPEDFEVRYFDYELGDSELVDLRKIIEEKVILLS